MTAMFFPMGRRTAVLFFVLVAGCRSAMPGDAGDPREVMNQFLQALNTADLAAVSRLFTADATAFLPLNEIPERVEGRDAIAASLAPMFAELKKSSEGPPYMNLQAKNVRVQSLGDVAVITFDAGSSQVVSRRTLVVVHTAEGWRVSHFHGSNVRLPGRAERAFTMEFESEGRTYNPFRDPVRSFVTEFAVFLKRDGAAPKAAAILPASGATMTEQPARKPSRKRAPSLSPPDAPRGAVDLARAIIREAVPSATESVKWNSPSFATSEHFATFFLRAKTGFQVVLHLGAKGRPGTRLRDEVRDPAGLLEWRGADRAIVTFVDEKDVRAKRDAFTSILRQWVGFL